MKYIRILTFLFLFISLSFAGVTGKVSGQIIDTNTGESLIGANVMLVGTTLGAATDEEGYYHILSVPPGYYDIRVNMIGYGDNIFYEQKVEANES